jgi:hypothetical protein
MLGPLCLNQPEYRWDQDIFEVRYRARIFQLRSPGQELPRDRIGGREQCSKARAIVGLRICLREVLYNGEWSAGSM